MKYIYLIEHRQLDSLTNSFELYRTEAFSSKLKANASVDNSLIVNEGYGLTEEETYYLDEEMLRRVDYSTLGYGRDEARVEMRLRMIINKVELR